MRGWLKGITILLLVAEMIFAGLPYAYDLLGNDPSGWWPLFVRLYSWGVALWISPFLFVSGALWGAAALLTIDPKTVEGISTRKS